MGKLDLTKTYKEYYSAKLKVEKVNFGRVLYLTILGKGEPAGQEFLEKTAAIYPVAYGVKKICKQNMQDFGVPKLEGLWWVNDKRPALEVPRSEWYWKLLIRMPEFVTQEIALQAISDVIKKKTSTASDVKFETIDEGGLVSILHTGPYQKEPDSLKLMDYFIAANNLSKTGLHHEIYLTDPNKTEPNKLKTILRQPVQ